MKSLVKDLENFEKLIRSWAKQFLIFFKNFLQQDLNFKITFISYGLHKDFVKSPHYLTNKDIEIQILKIKNNLNNSIVKIYSSVTIRNGLKIYATNSYYEKACYSNVAVAMNFKELSKYLSDHGICYGQVCLLAKIKLEAKIFNLVLIQWYDFKSKKTPFDYGCPRLQLTEIYNIIDIDAIKDNVHIIPRFDKDNDYLVNKYIF
ncbi:zn-finger domain-containing protein [Gigaspora margarita]|uniref:Zn-finger domain-containing protein n=1 Tax=Gigaspora margarita TaxID=4874 RepID=A0A8H4ATQ2_GIGMA|nr:zn-finger domain-containing protein [Gigaspora margarita]